MCWWYAHAQLEPFGTPLADEKAALLSYSVFRSQMVRESELSPADFYPDREDAIDRAREAASAPSPEGHPSDAAAARILEMAKRQGLLQ